MEELSQNVLLFVIPCNQLLGFGLARLDCHNDSWTTSFLMFFKLPHLAGAPLYNLQSTSPVTHPQKTSNGSN